MLRDKYAIILLLNDKLGFFEKLRNKNVCKNYIKYT
jgi:hypothetical protein